MSDVSPESREKGKSLRPLRMLVPFIAPYKGILALAMVALSEPGPSFSVLVTIPCACTAGQIMTAAKIGIARAESLNRE